MNQVGQTRIITHANWLLVALTALLFATGMVNLYSASAVRVEDGIRLAGYYSSQLQWGAMGLGCMVFCMIFDYRHLRGLALPLFIASLAMLALVPVAGKTVNGATRWLALGSFNVQPSELAKISVLIMAAKLLSRGKEPLGWQDLGLTLGMAILPVAMIIVQPDLGTALNILLLVGGMILYRGVRASILKSGLAFMLASPLILWKCVWPRLHDYQKLRVLTFLDPFNDPKGAGYHIIQAQIAIGSGQIWGKGFLQGTQSKLRFLPEKHTDFAIAVFGEEWGFVGCVALVCLFCLFLLSIFTTARDAKDRFGSMLAAGVFFYFFWQILINIGMVIGLMPVVGIPLPFISYGGSATLVNFCLLGLVLNISMRRFVFKFKTS